MGLPLFESRLYYFGLSTDQSDIHAKKRGQNHFLLTFGRIVLSHGELDTSFYVWEKGSRIQADSAFWILKLPAFYKTSTLAPEVKDKSRREAMPHWNNGQIL